MSKLIYVDKLKKDILDLPNCYNGFSDTFDKACIIGVIEEQPTIEERKTGMWVDDKRQKLDGTFHWFRKCDQCGYERTDDNPDNDSNYCPDCGARMEVEHD